MYFFTFKNYKSFRDEVTLDLSATKITEFPNQIITKGKEKLLPVSAIYGANASGKSNVYQAFEYMTYYVLESFVVLSNILSKYRIVFSCGIIYSKGVVTGVEVYMSVLELERLNKLFKI